MIPVMPHGVEHRVMLTESYDGFIRLDLGDGCVAKFRAATYYQAIADGRAETRAREQARCPTQEALSPAREEEG